MSWLSKLFSGVWDQQHRHPMGNIRGTDLAQFNGSSCCPVCSLYQRRIFSVSGRDKRFPRLSSLPDEIHDGKCDVCKCSYSLYSWFEGVSTPDVKTAIRNSKAPLVDRRTPEQIEAFEKDQAKLARRLARQQAQNK
jgi:hypothetical protein